MSQDFFEQDHRIHNPELAHHIRSGEYPYRELATVALNLGLSDKYTEYLHEAHEAGIAAGEAYLESLQGSLDHYRNGFEANLDITEHSEAKLLYINVKVSEPDFQSFALNHGLSWIEEKHNRSIDKTKYHMPYNLKDKDRQQHSKRIATQAWRSLVTLYQETDEGWYGGPTSYKPTIETRLDFNQEASKFTFNSLVQLVDEYNVARAKHPRATPAGILGNRFGPRSIQFVEEFVEYKKQQLAQRAPIPTTVLRKLIEQHNIDKIA